MQMRKGEKMRLIDADALLDDVIERYCNDCDKRKGIKNGKYRIIYEIGEAPCLSCGVNDMAGEIEDAPTIDVPDRKVGEWLEPTREGCITYDKHAYAECSACGEKAYLGWWMRYCPNCGARMKGEKNA